MPHRDLKTSAGFLPDSNSQRLCLEDAQKSRSPAAMLHALQAVASARGLPRFARDVSMTQSELAGLLAGEDQSHATLIAELIKALLAKIAAPSATTESAKMTKSRRAGGKSGGAAKR